MQPWWDKIRPFVLSFGMHAAVLLLLVADFSQRPAASAHAGRGRLIHASLVAWPAASFGAVGAQVSQSHPVTAPAVPTPRSAAEQQPAKAVPKPQKVASSAQASDTKPSHAASQPVQDAAPANVSLDPDPDDPYAQMRRERAEAERRYQLQQQAMKQIEDANAQQGQSAAPDASAALPFGGQDSDQGGANTFLAGLQFNAGSTATLAQGQPWTQCEADATTPRNGDADTLAWIECLLDPWQTAPEAPDPKGSISWPVRLSE